MVDAKAIKDKVSKKISSTKSKISSHVSAHKHCRICGVNVDHRSEERVCKNQECIDKFEKRERNDKVMRVMFFVFVLIFFVPILLRAIGVLG